MDCTDHCITGNKFMALGATESVGKRQINRTCISFRKDNYCNARSTAINASCNKNQK